MQIFNLISTVIAIFLLYTHYQMFNRLYETYDILLNSVEHNIRTKFYTSVESLESDFKLINHIRKKSRMFNRSIYYRAVFLQGELSVLISHKIIKNTE